jgi:hypothetical protein
MINWLRLLVQNRISGLRRRYWPWSITLLALLSAALACRGPGGPPDLLFTPDQLPPATIGQPYTASITISQNLTPVGQMSVSLADLPPGLNFAFAKGQDAAQIGGTPRKSGTYKFTVSAWCFGTNTAGQLGHHDYILVVQ